MNKDLKEEFKNYNNPINLQLLTTKRNSLIFS